MTPVKQTIFGSENGNCLAACIASMLNIPIDHVPNWGIDIEYNVNTLNMFLSNYGMFHVLVNIKDLEEQLISCNGYYILCGESFSELCDHAVIYRNAELFFDPMPNGKGLKGTIRNERYYQAIFIIPKEI